METCVGWLLDVYIEDDKAILWIKTQDRKVLKLVDDYHPSFYILPKNEHDRKELLHIFSQQIDIVQELSCEQKPTSLFDGNGSILDLIFVGIDSVRAYRHILKKLEKDPRVEQLFNIDLLDVQQYLFTKLKIEPTSKVKVKYDGFKLYGISKIDDDDEMELAPPPFSCIYVEIKTADSDYEKNSFDFNLGHLDNPILTIRVRNENNEEAYFQDCKEEEIIRNFASYVMDRDPDIIVCEESTSIQHVFGRIKRLGLECIQLGRDDLCCVNDDDLFTSIKNSEGWWIRGRVCISSRVEYEITT
jgi:DNA polymerase elongation subunit (family B)